MRNFLYKFNMFMQGRYGSDQLNLFLLVLSVIISIVFMFTPLRILRVLSIVPLGIVIFRSMSRNIYKRASENNAFLPFFNKITGWFSLTHKKFRDGKTHRYYTCPQCKAQLRVKYVKGKHTIKCPKCGNQFSKKIW